MKQAYERLFPYLPVIYLLVAYLVGGIGQCLVVGEARYAMLGVITLPWAPALAVASIRIWRKEKSRGLKSV